MNTRHENYQCPYVGPQWQLTPWKDDDTMDAAEEDSDTDMSKE